MPAPTLFISHGSPMIALEPPESYARALGQLATRFSPPVALAVCSAHWETRGPVRVTAARAPGVIHDFGGFPPPLYELDYPAPGDPELAASVAAHLRSGGLDAALDETRGWDHGVWVPLRLAFPRADVPVVQLSLPATRTPRLVLRMGEALRPLRERGVWLVGSGGLVHNLATPAWDSPAAPAPAWAVAFEEWALERIRRRDLEALESYSALPLASTAHPTTEHLDPVFFALGGAEAGDQWIELHRGFSHGSLSLACFAFGSSR